MKKKCLRMDIAVFRKTSAKKLQITKKTIRSFQKNFSQKITNNQKNNSQ